MTGGDENTKQKKKAKKRKMEDDLDLLDVW